MLTDIEKLAILTLAKGKAISEGRDGVEPGTHPVDFTVHVTGTVTVKPDTTISASYSPSLIGALAVILSGFDFNLSEQQELLTNAIKEFESLEKAEQTQKTAVLEAVVKSIATIEKAKLPKVARRGSVSGIQLTAEPVETAVQNAVLTETKTVSKKTNLKTTNEARKNKLKAALSI